MQCPTSSMCNETCSGVLSSHLENWRLDEKHCSSITTKGFNAVMFIYRTRVTRTNTLHQEQRIKSLPTYGMHEPHSYLFRLYNLSFTGSSFTKTSLACLKQYVQKAQQFNCTMLFRKMRTTSDKKQGTVICANALDVCCLLAMNT